MIRRILIFIGLFMIVGCPLFGGEKQPVKPQDQVFVKITAEQKSGIDPKRDLVMGSYLLKREAVDELAKIETFKNAFEKIRTTDWTAGPWTKKNADLTLRQRMNDYLQSADEFYSGKGQRPDGVIGERLEKYSDIELGDRHLKSAIITVQMAAAWKIPLQKGQAEKLDRVTQKRIRLIREGHRDAK